VRVDGPHLYVAPLVPDDAERARREAEADAVVAERLGSFPARWAATAAALDAEAVRLLESAPPADRAEALLRLDAAVGHERTAWHVHFTEMYVLLAGHLAYRERLAGLGVPADLADACLAGFPTRPSRADAALLAAATACHVHGVTDPAAVAGHPEVGPLVQALLAEHGWRADGVADVALPSWREQPGRVVERIVALAHHLGPRPPPDPADRVARRDAARTRAREAACDPDAFDRAVATAEAANWIWWNEEHNGLVDLRATLPLRRAARDAGALVLDDPDAALLCALTELRGALSGGPPPSKRLLDERAAWLREGRMRRSTRPVLRGRAPTGDGADLVVAEVFGGTPPRLDDRPTLYGLGASAGRAQGRVRVVASAEGLDALEPGEILVCEATSPNWGFAFALAGAVVCDNGGPTTHAAICAREYALPCVVSARGATRRLRDGQIVEVDGERGTVSLLDG
jgi:pyruvate,water dikinase